MSIGVVSLVKYELSDRALWAGSGLGWCRWANTLTQPQFPVSVCLCTLKLLPDCYPEVLFLNKYQHFNFCTVVTVAWFLLIFFCINMSFCALLVYSVQAPFSSLSTWRSSGHMPLWLWTTALSVRGRFCMRWGWEVKDSGPQCITGI